jgi:hypothetical protein
MTRIEIPIHFYTILKTDKFCVNAHVFSIYNQNIGLHLISSFSFQVRYTGFRDRPQEERRIRFQNGCREGHTEIAFVATGINLQLVFNPNHSIYGHERECDFDKEHGKVSRLYNI